MSDTPAKAPGAAPRDGPAAEPAGAGPGARRDAAARYLDQWELHLSLLATAGTRRPPGEA